MTQRKKTIKKSKDRSEEGLSIAFEHNGNTFYEYAQIDSMPTVRVEAFLSRSHEVEELGLRRSDLQGFCKTVTEAGNEGRHMDVQTLNGYLSYLLTLPCNAIPVIYCVASTLVLNDEPADVMRADDDYKKQKLAQEDDKIGTFFFEIYDKLVKESASSLDSGLLQDFMKEMPTKKQREVEQIFLNSITRSS